MGLEDVTKSITMLNGNKAIETVQEAAEKLWGIAKTSNRGISGTVNNMIQAGDGNLGKAAKAAFSNKTGTGLDGMQIAGSYIGASAAYRAVSGGGLYKDKNGNTNLVGIPFV